MKIIVTIAMLLLTQTAAASNCDFMFPYGKPVVTADVPVTYLCRRMYAVEHSPTRKTPFWAAERLTKDEQLKHAVRENAFKADPDLPPNEAARPSDYAGSGYDQGHVAPVGDMHADPIAMLESFYLSNMMPQVPGNNRNGWNHLEYLVRGYALKRNLVYVYTGPIYQCNPCATIGKGQVAVPTHLYKIVIDTKRKEMMVFLVPNVAFDGKDIPKYISDLATVQGMTNIRFLPKTKTIKASPTLWP